MKLKPCKKIGLLKSSSQYADTVEKDESVIKITVLGGESGEEWKDNSYFSSSIIHDK